MSVPDSLRAFFRKKRPLDEGSTIVGPPSKQIAPSSSQVDLRLAKRTPVHQSYKLYHPFDPAMKEFVSRGECPLYARPSLSQSSSGTLFVYKLKISSLHVRSLLVRHSTFLIHTLCGSTAKASRTLWRSRFLWVLALQHSGHW